jgi:Mg/Co/Ni transporter MgtE
MKRYKVICYPNVKSYNTIVEAESVEEAIEVAQEEASINAYFMAVESDVEEV